MSVNWFYAQDKSNCIIPLLFLFLEGSHGISESVGSTLNLIDGIGGTLGLVATLTNVTTPLLKDKGKVLGHCLGESIGRALDIHGGIGGSLAALADVATPLGESCLRSSGSLDSASGENRNDDGCELHLGG